MACASRSQKNVIEQATVIEVETGALFDYVQGWMTCGCCTWARIRCRISAPLGKISPALLGIISPVR
jgi:hypothetical protein